VQACLLEQAAAPAKSSQGHRRAWRNSSAVCRQRQRAAGREAGHHVVASLGAGREHCARLEAIRKPTQGGGPCVRSEGSERLVLGDVHYVDAVPVEVHCRPEEKRVHRLPK